MSSQVWWFATRSTGIAALVLLTASMVLGILTSSRYARPNLPRFVTMGLHRNVSLLVLAFLAMHIVTTVVDSFAPISWTDALLPFAGTYRPFWLGLGALSFDLLIALTSRACCGLGWATGPGAGFTGRPTRAGPSQSCTASAPEPTTSCRCSSW